MGKRERERERERMQNEGDSKNDCKTREIGSVREKKK